MAVWPRKEMQISEADSIDYEKFASIVQEGKDVLNALTMYMDSLNVTLKEVERATRDLNKAADKAKAVHDRGKW
jgi:hypothetical protein